MENYKIKTTPYPYHVQVDFVLQNILFLSFCVGNCDPITFGEFKERMDGQENLDIFLRQHVWAIEVQKDMNEKLILSKVLTDRCSFHIIVETNGVELVKCVLPYKRQDVYHLVHSIVFPLSSL